ncbi:uncharacterized protein LOC112057716 [Bicyclus anynana]|uniref:Uncharacterized protein LOC112057716 n=1 Tax=Bicyclus anynana TaxID=110368 RepID=A0A6J1P831_BICAN|nr:uncharacterized protein LOC112057716 [Bicyclus anynana]XP_052744381.1 uncharacterized protein LOC112057716 [Bicyclus anynana]
MTFKSDPRNRMSEEFQLLAEEKWIIETLNKLKQQRNSLQIERLQLESLKAKFRPSSILTKPSVPQVSVPEQPAPSKSAVNIVQIVTIKPADNIATVEKRLDDETCNDEELNLVVTNPIFNRHQNTDFNIEEDEEEEFDNTDFYIDMNMFMNGELED